MYILPDDNRTGIEICRRFYFSNLIQLCALFGELFTLVIISALNQLRIS